MWDCEGWVAGGELGVCGWWEQEAVSGRGCPDHTRGRYSDSQAGQAQTQIPPRLEVRQGFLQIGIELSAYGYLPNCGLGFAKQIPQTNQLANFDF